MGLRPRRIYPTERVAARYAGGDNPAAVALIGPRDPNDPIGGNTSRPSKNWRRNRQSADPIGDHSHSPVEGIVASLSGSGAVQAGACLRGVLPLLLPPRVVGPGQEPRCSQRTYRSALDYIRSHGEIWEVILTGGDPLMPSPRRLAEIMPTSPPYDHVRIIRLHTRVPSPIPRASPTDGRGTQVRDATTWWRCMPIIPRIDRQWPRACGA